MHSLPSLGKTNKCFTSCHIEARGWEAYLATAAEDAVDATGDVAKKCLRCKQQAEMAVGERRARDLTD